MSDTHPNAYRFQADEKRKEAAKLLEEARTLEAQADALENPLEATPVTPVATVGEPQEDAPKGKLFNKK